MGGDAQRGKRRRPCRRCDGGAPQAVGETRKPAEPSPSGEVCSRATPPAAIPRRDDQYDGARKCGGALRARKAPPPTRASTKETRSKRTSFNADTTTTAENLKLLHLQRPRRHGRSRRQHRATRKNAAPSVARRVLCADFKTES